MLLYEVTLDAEPALAEQVEEHMRRATSQQSRPPGASGRSDSAGPLQAGSAPATQPKRRPISTATFGSMRRRCGRSSAGSFPKESRSPEKPGRWREVWAEVLS